MSFNVDGQAVETKFKINKTGFVLNDVIGIETFEPEMKNNLKNVCVKGDVSKFELDNKDSIEL